MKNVARAAILMMFVLPAVPRVADACGMKVEEISGEPRELLVRAYDDAAAGRDAKALRVATTVTRKENATANQKAQAWSIVGAMRFKAGNKTSGLAAFAEAKKLDDGAVETVLAKLGTPAVAKKKSAPVKASTSAAEAAPAKSGETLVAEIRAALQDA